jgi:D-alanyl-lipoteichoic acid acyltransferase DltB (MBOAT superfamily)
LLSRIVIVARWVPLLLVWLLLGAGLARLAGRTFVVLLLTLGITTYAMALLLRFVQAGREGSTLPRRLLFGMVSVLLVVFAYVSLTHRWHLIAPVTLGVVVCHCIAYLVDVSRGEADTNRPLSAALYLVQFPVVIAGPLSRYREFTGQLSRGSVTLGAFAYGIRRVVIGLIKAVLIAGTLAVTADAIFAAPPGRLTAGAAWLGAVCYALQVYLLFSGYCDVAIGVGRTIGLRYPENFRRPYTADSIREFWRRWNVTLITWLRDYFHLPIAGQDEPMLRLYAYIVAGFCFVGLWHGGGATFVVWGFYCGSWLALESIGLRPHIERAPAVVRHAYVLSAVTVGWVILRAPHVTAAADFLKAMIGVHTDPSLDAGRYVSTSLWLALAVGVFAAGPLVPSVSRWRVSVDAATTSLLMMLAATGLFLWRGPSLGLRSIRPTRTAVPKWLSDSWGDEHADTSRGPNERRASSGQ